MRIGETVNGKHRSHKVAIAPSIVTQVQTLSENLPLYSTVIMPQHLRNEREILDGPVAESAF